MSLEGKGEDLTITICCVPGKDSEGKDTYVTNVCYQNFDKTSNSSLSSGGSMA